jgi:hypothetical protein
MWKNYLDARLFVENNYQYQVRRFRPAISKKKQKVKQGV